ncbi:uncharacterized protein EKO05_0008256 [Ascochyta rabiei]|uniref:Uncharacterized protein n=1 Tax=Didymella rabiei TaxID=5454 RepID=A0A163DFP7_DIDRA|nr:uncharacterized protein EKO05_0008256 [Ascochyta rabiei]KZM23129.1 hypothetical protein ST47_g5781 [Ascochyta rabiei]UPX17930.1 hypothetical protein EKO05_0008256 [Ascochyta rabiei]
MATTTDAKPAPAPLPSSLKTPMSATYPSELKSPMILSATTPTFAWIKREDSLKTPITPPAAYLDFLKTLSPALMSPMSTGTSTRFVFEGRPTSITSSTSSGSFTSTSGPADKDSPATSRSSSCSRSDSKDGKDEVPMSAPPTKIRTQTITIPPPSPFTRPQSARTPRLYIPQSPFSPAAIRSPTSADSATNSATNSAISPFPTASPKVWEAEAKSGRSRRVSVREVVTRTVTYSSTPVDKKAPSFPQIDPAPRGKRRKIE